MAQEEMDNQWLRMRNSEKYNTKLQSLQGLCENNEVQTFKYGQYILPIREVVLS